MSQLTNVKYGNARYPMQYNQNHFTYVNDENGVANRWAGFFSTQRNGLDTLYYIGDDVLRNASNKELDSTLKAWQKQEPDSISYFSVYKDSTYTFPITNYQSSLLETRVAGNNEQVSEVRREGNYKFLYKLKVDSVALRKRNINARPTTYIKGLLQKERLATGNTIQAPVDSSSISPQKNIFQNEFEDEKKDTTTALIPGKNNEALQPVITKPNVLSKSSLYNYKLKFNADYVLAGITNNVLINNYQPYGGGSGPIQLNNGSDVDFTFRVGVSDVMEDIKNYWRHSLWHYAFQIKMLLFLFQNYRKRLDWGLTYYRSNVSNYNGFFTGDKALYDNMLYTNIYQANISYPFSETNSFRVIAGIRTDRGTLRPNLYIGLPDINALPVPDSVSSTLLSRMEFVHDNTINPAQNIWNGFRWKIYAAYNIPLSKGSALKGMNTIMVGVDARHYYKIYRNFIWATRVAADFSFGDAKMIYYLGGADGWINPKFNYANSPNPAQPYAFQTLAINMRAIYKMQPMAIMIW